MTTVCIATAHLRNGTEARRRGERVLEAAGLKAVVRAARALAVGAVPAAELSGAVIGVGAAVGPGGLLHPAAAGGLV
eukprot:SAG22_NODE_17997_length_295_cov_0.785714_1_plen_76_part_10